MAGIGVGLASGMVIVLPDNLPVIVCDPRFLSSLFLLMLDPLKLREFNYVSVRITNEHRCFAIAEGNGSFCHRQSDKLLDH